MVVDDVARRHNERGERTTTEQVRTILRRFEDAAAIEFDDEDCTLTDKGQEHACLLHRIVKLLAEQAGRQDEDGHSGSDQSGDGSQTEPQSSTAPTGTNRIASQVDPRQFTGGSTLSTAASSDSQTLPNIIPAYWLITDTERANTAAQSGPALPLTTMTTEELVERATHLHEEYGTDGTLVPYWTLQMGEELHPLEEAELSLDAVNPWTLLTGTSQPADDRAEDEQS
ncbi:hypothetical protein [Halocatena pleomorpha]|uniref:Uncharacterized protein n=1 Tax=Halocatena pleomorpha TaxID=1785090 RepID=A0A3P3RED0_9EURY|nr:hypothetical protein [Halocatena pleomorpha]RRJ31862.1 hypothetical protein EIK79_06265 [Halocatena pleomorpha]